MAEAVGKASASVRELEQRWPDWVTELREQQTTLSTRKANASEVNERLDEVESRIASLARQMAHSMPDVLERVGQLEHPRAQQAAQLDDVARALSKAATEMAEMRAASRHSKQQLGALSTERQAHAAALASLETRMRQVGSMAEEHARYLVTLSDALHEKGVSAPKYRSSYISQTRVAPSMLPEEAWSVCAGTSVGEAVGAASVRPAPASGGLELGGALGTPPSYRADELMRGDDSDARQIMHEAVGTGFV